MEANELVLELAKQMRAKGRHVHITEETGDAAQFGIEMVSTLAPAASGNHACTLHAIATRIQVPGSRWEFRGLYINTRDDDGELRETDPVQARALVDERA